MWLLLAVIVTTFVGSLVIAIRYDRHVEEDDNDPWGMT